MKKKFLSVALICTLAASLTLPSCIGSFALTNKLLAWNQTIDNKFVNELVFFAFLIVPVYEVSALADVLVLNSIEFWSGTSPVASSKSMIEGRDGKYLVECDGKGYTITSVNDGSAMRLDFNADTQTWSYVGEEGKEYELLQFVDDTHVKVPGIDGTMITTEISQQGLFAYQQQLLGQTAVAMR